MTAHEDALKGQAKRLRTALAEENVVLGHRKTLDLIARVHGWRNWHVLSAALNEGKPITSGLTQAPAPRTPVEKPRMNTKHDGSVPEYLDTTLTTTDGTPIADVFSALPNSIGRWERSRETEAGQLKAGVHAIHYVRQDKKKPTLAFVVGEGGQHAQIANIVPSKKGDSIEIAESNQLEQEFVTALRSQLPAHVTVRQNAATKHLRDLVSAATYDLMRHHSANKSTGNSHPMDRKRWLNFVAQAAQEGLDDRDEHVHLVRQALLSEGFSEWHAEQMSTEFGIQIEAMHAVM